MKRHLAIGWFLLLALTACQHSVETQNFASEQPAVSQKLQSVDSLMWRQPDSALALLLPWFDTCGDAMLASPKDPAGETALETHSMRLYNRHYAHLLLAELLYKNDYAQANREALLDAVAYFDSLVRQAPPLKGGRGDSRHVLDQKGNPAFLSARAHYINGVGYYEQDSVVEACREYLKALEVMEERFEEKELVKHKARFLAYTYNRLMELFSTQFMMDPAIECGEKALMFCKIEPTSSEGVPNILYRLGKQYDKMHEIDKARTYYSQALESITKTDNIVYRDIVSSKALCDYEKEGDVKQAMEELNYALIHAKTEKERLNRYLTIGGIHFLEGNYDSALFYLEPVFEDNEAGLQAQAAGYLRIIYDSIGDREQSDAYMRFLTSHMKPEGENKALVSQLEDMYKDYSNQKLEKQAEAERETAKKKVLNTVIPIAVTIALVVFLVLMLRGRRLLKNQQEEADRAFGEAEQEHEKELRLWQAEADKTLEETKKKHEAEMEVARKTHWLKQEILRQNLQQKVEQVSALETVLIQQRKEAELRREALLNEPVCQSIVNKVGDLHLTSRTRYSDHPRIRLDEAVDVQLGEAVSKHFPEFKTKIMLLSSKLDRKDLQICYLYLLGLNESQIALLQQCHHSTVYRRTEKLKKTFGTDAPLSEFIQKTAFS